MNSSAKQKILSRLRQNTVTDAPIGNLADEYDKHIVTADQKLVELESLLKSNHAEVLRSSKENLAKDFLAWASMQTKEQTTPFVVSNHDCLNELRHHLSDQTDSIKTDQVDQASLFDKVALSVCYADCGVADKGALLLNASANQPRTLSLVPNTSVIVIDAESIYATLEECLASSHFKATSMPSNIIFISGPSKTADIQQTLAYGAHGPKRLIVFILCSANNAQA